MTVQSQQYVYVQNPPANRAGGGQGGGQGRTGGGSQAGGQGRTGSGGTGSASRSAGVPKGLPPILGNRQVIFYAWMAAMILVGFDEWHNYGILPRPQRLWYTSLTYGLLTLLSAPDSMVPLANALAVGYTFTLLWQYYNGTGQFGKTQ